MKVLWTPQPAGSWIYSFMLTTVVSLGVLTIQQVKLAVKKHQVSGTTSLLQRTIDTVHLRKSHLGVLMQLNPKIY